MTNKEFRQQAAIAAMQGLLSFPTDKMNRQQYFETLSKDAHEIADALLAEEIKRHAVASSAKLNESPSHDNGKTLPPNPDWIEWNGGECPVDGDTVVEVKLRSGATGTRKAKAYVWKHLSNLGGQIIRYRVVAPQGDE